MNYEVVKGENYEWVVEAIDYDDEVDSGIIYRTVFCGYDAEGQSREYAAWKNEANVLPLRQ